LSRLDPVSNFQVVNIVLNIFETEQLQIENWVETGQNYLVLSPVEIRQDSFVKLSGFICSYKLVKVLCVCVQLTVVAQIVAAAHRDL